MATPRVVAADEQHDVEVDLDRWADLARRVLADEGRSGELTLTFVGEDDIRELHREHLGDDTATDVLSFPLDAGEPHPPDPPARTPPVLLGDVVVCPAVAARNAPDHAGTLDDELALLVVHGILHVLGHDHAGDDDTAAMRERELHHLRAWHWNGPEPDGFSLVHRGEH